MLLLLSGQSSTYLALVQRTNFQGLYLATLSAGASTITVQQRAAPFGGVGNLNLKPPTSATPTLTLNSSSVTAEGAAAVTFAFSATIANMTFDDTIASVDVSYSIVGSDAWHPWVPCVFTPSSGSSLTVNGVVHGLAGGQSYDVALQPRGVNGQALGSPLILGNSPTVDSSTINAAIVNWNEFGGTLNTDGTISNADGAVAHTVIASSGTTAGAVIHAKAMITKGSNTGGFAFPGGTALPGSGLYLFNGTTGYFAVWQTDAHFVLYQNNAGTVTALGSVYVPAINQSDTNAHFLQLTMRLISGGQVALTASIDNVTPLSVTGSTIGSLIGGTVSCQVSTGGASGKISRFSLKCGVQAHDTAPPSYTGNFDSTGKAKASTMFVGTTPNTIAYVTDATIEFSWTGTGPYTVKVWFDSGTAATDSAVIWPDGSTSVNLGHTTSASPSFSASSIPSGTNYYAVLHVQNGVVTMTVQTTPFTTAQFAAFFADGGIVPAAAQAGTPLFTASGSGGSGAVGGGGGGHNLK